MIRIPASLPPDVRLAFGDVRDEFARLTASSNTDLHGRRLINAGDAIDPFDYVTLSHARRLVKESTPAAAVVSSDVSGEVLYGTHAVRLTHAAGSVAEGTLFYETDRAAFYQSETVLGLRVWLLAMCRPLRTVAALPADLGVNDEGFTWFDSYAGVTHRWSGNAWNRYLGMMVDTFGNMPNRALVDRGFLFAASDRGYQVWRNGVSAWVLLEGSGGPAAGTIANITTGLTADDVGYLYNATDYNRVYRWNGSAWEDAPGAESRGKIVHFIGAPDPIAGWALCDGAGATSSTSTGGTVGITTPDMIDSNAVLRSGASAGGVGGAATHTHKVDPPDTASGDDSAWIDVPRGTGAVITVATDPHHHHVDIAEFDSGAGDSYPPYYEGIPYVRL
jgi:hypothetical protein